jgi:hypothetical protein
LVQVDDAEADLIGRLHFQFAVVDLPRHLQRDRTPIQRDRVLDGIIRAPLALNFDAYDMALVIENKQRHEMQAFGVILAPHRNAREVDAFGLLEAEIDALLGNDGFRRVFGLARRRILLDRHLQCDRNRRNGGCGGRNDGLRRRSRLDGCLRNGYGRLLVQ